MKGGSFGEQRRAVLLRQPERLQQQQELVKAVIFYTCYYYTVKCWRVLFVPRCNHIIFITI